MRPSYGFSSFATIRYNPLMHYVIAGLGNPGEEYERTRHNTGRIVLDAFRKREDLPDWEFDKKMNALVSKGKLGKHTVTLLEPETFMNKSGSSVAYLVKSKRAAEALVIIYDDLDMPLGKLKISFNRSSGGHKGLESIIRAVKTEAFARLRVGISLSTPSGKLKKPSGDEKVHDFIIGKWKDAEFAELKKVSKKACDALAAIVVDGRAKAMGEFN